ncbi:MAG: hypothetical protein IPO86_10175 [Saprospiraceae bacterium]|nr:hypothetical protein [Saprospiraceae bacterium]
MNRLFKLFIIFCLVASCKDDNVITIIDEPMDPIDTIDVPKIDCYIGKYEKPDIFFAHIDTTNGVAFGYKNCYKFRANSSAQFANKLKTDITISLQCYLNPFEYYDKELYVIGNVPFSIGRHPIKSNITPMFKLEDDYVLYEYSIDSNVTNNFITINAIDSTLKIIKGEFSVQYYFSEDFNQGRKRTEPDTIRLQQIKFWSKYQ